MPAGLSINASTGAVTGTPSSAGTYNINVTINNGSAGSSTSSFVITIGTMPAITSSPTLGGGVDRPFTSVLQASGATPISWTMTSGPTPTSNIQLDSNGVLSWLIPVAGFYNFTVTATNEFGTSSPVVFTLEITTPSIIDVNLPVGILTVP